MRVRRRNWFTEGDTSNRELFLALWVVQHWTPYHRVPPWQSFQEKRDVGPITNSQTIDDVYNFLPTVVWMFDAVVGATPH